MAFPLLWTVFHVQLPERQNVSVTSAHLFREGWAAFRLWFASKPEAVKVDKVFVSKDFDFAVLELAEPAPSYLPCVPTEAVLGQKFTIFTRVPMDFCHTRVWCGSGAPAASRGSFLIFLVDNF